jgi:type 1 fimbria pilin
MMKQMHKSACALVVLAATSLPALAATSADVRVIGTITPASCTPTLGDGGAIDYGSINPTTLSSTDYTVMPEKTLAFSIICDAPAKVGLKAINGRPNTVAGATEAIPGWAKTPVPLLSLTAAGVAGLGLSNGQKVGGYAMDIKSLVADGEPASTIITTDQVNWGNIGTYYGFFRHVGTVPFVITAADTGTTVPKAFKTLDGVFHIQAYINKTSELDTSTPVALDGLTTVELVYL